MSAGRPRKPTKTKELQGTLRKCRVNQYEPDPSRDLMVAPDYLTEDARHNFAHIAIELDKIGANSSTFTVMAAEAACLLEMAQNCQLYISAFYQEHQCYSYRTSNSFGDHIYKELPEVGIRLSATAKLKAYLSELGLGPGSIAKLISLKKKEPETKSKWDM